MWCTGIMPMLSNVNLAIIIFAILSIDLIEAHLKPRLDRNSEQKSQNVGTKFKLDCFVQEGTKPFQFEWSKNGQLLSSNASPSIRYRIDTNEDDSILFIEKLDTNDSGNYSCKVWNSFGHDHQQTKLIVKGLIVC